LSRFIGKGWGGVSKQKLNKPMTIMRNKNVLSKIQSRLPSLREVLGMGLFMLSFGTFAQGNCEKHFAEAKAILETNVWHL
jgi:hypothetical protein